METIRTPLETTQTPLITKDEMAELLDIKSPYETYTIKASDLTGWSSSSSTTWEPTTITYPATYKTYITTDDVSTIAGLASDAAKKEDLEKIDKHIDELEQDIDFFDEERKKQEADLIASKARITKLEDKVNYLMSENDTLNSRIIHEEENQRELQKEIDNLRGYIDFIVNRLRNQQFDF